jgi:nitrite reductase/ring-hydroxylating ferredoxin subunit
MTKPWIELGLLADFPEHQPVLRKFENSRFACVKDGEQVHALDDRCPHQGYPLSQGVFRDGVLTCSWHNWKFEACSGSCTFGGEPVRKYATRIENGLVFLDPSVDWSAEIQRLTQSLLKSLYEDQASSATRDALRLVSMQQEQGLDVKKAWELPFQLVVQSAVERVQWGFDHSLATIADLLTWVDSQAIDYTATFALAATLVGESLSYQTKRPEVVPEPCSEPAEIVRALEQEQHERTAALVLDLVHQKGASFTLEHGLLPYATKHLYGYGHGLIFLTKALCLAERFPSLAGPIMASAATNLAWATAESALPGWQFTRKALDSLDTEIVEKSTPLAAARSDFEAKVLESEPAAVRAVTQALEAGTAPGELLRVIAHAASERLLRFDPTWEERTDAEVGILDVTHAVTFAEAACHVVEKYPVFGARLAILAAAFVGKLRRADGDVPELRTGTATATKTVSVGQWLSEVHARRELQAKELTVGLDASQIQEAFQAIAPFLAFDAAIRPIRAMHAVKLGEALRKLHLQDMENGVGYLQTLIHSFVPKRPERNFRRIAQVAEDFMKTGRPPVELY